MKTKREITEQFETFVRILEKLKNEEGSDMIKVDLIARITTLVWVLGKGVKYGPR